jgi:peptidoglycan/xylan/chitin deacetylase (PgdA/CDA1 family)
MADSHAKCIAITVDDLPGIGGRAGQAGLVEMNKRMLAALRVADSPAIGFVNECKLHVEGQIDTGLSLLDAWLDAGMTLGNHTAGHKGLSTTPLEEYQNDVLRGETSIRLLLESRRLSLVYFRHPCNQTGPSKEIRQAFERFLTARGYRIAPYTIEFSDYIFSAIYDAALARGETDFAARMREQYRRHVEASLDWYEELSQDTFGREIPQVLQIHLNALQADTLPETLQLLTARNYRFARLDEVLTDEAYSTPDFYVGMGGPSWLHRWRLARSLPGRTAEHPPLPPDVWQHFERLQSLTMTL